MTQSKTLLLISITLAVAILTQGQSSPAHSGFDVASVKPAANADGQSLLQAVPGRLRMTNLTPRRLILNAYGIQDFQLAGDPPWLASEHYDIQATAAGDTSVQQMEGPMMQALLEERFKLAVHREIRQLPVYELAALKGGAKLQPSPQGGCTPYSADAPPPPAPAAGQPSRNYCGFQFKVEGLNRTLEGKGVTMPVLATTLSRKYTSDLGRNVIDKTGLSGTFDIHLNWAVEPLTSSAGVNAGPSADEAPPSLTTALQEQLGLRLESGKGPVEVWVVDHVEKPSAN